MAPRNLTVNDAILAFEAAAQKRPPAGWRAPDDIPKPEPSIDLRGFTAWLESDHRTRRRFNKLCKRINRIAMEAVDTRKPVQKILQQLPQTKPYTNLKLVEDLYWFNAQAARFGIRSEVIQWQLTDAR